MSKPVEIRLRIPNMKNRALDENGYPIDYATMRFNRVIEVPAIPKSGEVLQLPTQSGTPLPATVVRSDWHDDKGLFVVACRFANKSISPVEYSALTNDPGWELTPLI